MELEITSAFPTLIRRLRIPDADVINRILQALIIAEEAEYPSLARSNIGGWHSRPDFLMRWDTAVSALTVWPTWALRRVVDAAAGPTAFKGTSRGSSLRGPNTSCRHFVQCHDGLREQRSTTYA